MTEKVEEKLNSCRYKPPEQYEQNSEVYFCQLINHNPYKSGLISTLTDYMQTYKWWKNEQKASAG